jgi:hypothetical protein
MAKNYFEQKILREYLVKGFFLFIKSLYFRKYNKDLYGHYYTITKAKNQREIY